MCREITIQDLETEIITREDKTVRSWGRRCRSCEQTWIGGNLPGMEYLDVQELQAK